jgi:hypothetical protein
MKTRSWERAEELQRQIEDNNGPAKETPVTTVEFAVNAFVADGYRWESQPQHHREI